MEYLASILPFEWLLALIDCVDDVVEFLTRVGAAAVGLADKYVGIGLRDALGAIGELFSKFCDSMGMSSTQGIQLLNVICVTRWGRVWEIIEGDEIHHWLMQCLEQEWLRISPGIDIHSPAFAQPISRWYHHRMIHGNGIQRGGLLKWWYEWLDANPRATPDDLRKAVRSAKRIFGK